MPDTNATAHRIPGPIKVYLSAPAVDRHAMKGLRQALEAHGLGCTSRWLDFDELGHASFSTDRALMCLEDIIAAHVFVFWNELAAPYAGSNQRHHAESGFALAAMKPFVLVGSVTQEFHCHPFVQVQSPTVSPTRLSEVLTLAAVHGTPIPNAALMGRPGLRSPAVRMT